MTRRPGLRVGVAIASLLVVAACGNSAERDLCTQYAGLVTAVDNLRQEHPLTATAADLRAAAQKVEAELNQFQAVSEGRLDTAISTLRADVEAVRQAAVEDGTGSLATARPLLEDAMHEVSQDWAALQTLVDTQCGAA